MSCWFFVAFIFYIGSSALLAPVTLWILNLYGAANIKMDHGVSGWESVDQIVLTQGLVGSCEQSSESVVSIKCKKFIS